VPHGLGGGSAAAHSRDPGGQPLPQRNWREPAGWCAAMNGTNPSLSRAAGGSGSRRLQGPHYLPNARMGETEPTPSSRWSIPLTKTGQCGVATGSASCAVPAAEWGEL